MVKVYKSLQIPMTPLEARQMERIAALVRRELAEKQLTKLRYRGVPYEKAV